MRLRLTPLALRDFEHLHYFETLNFGVRQADDYLLGLLSTFDTIAAEPLAVAPRYEVHPPLRLRPHGAHHILYHIADDHVLILRVLHRSANWGDWL